MGAQQELAFRWREDLFSSFVHAAAFSPDSRLVAAVSSLPNRAVVFASDTGCPFVRVPEHDQPVMAVQFLPDDGAFLSAGDCLTVDADGPRAALHRARQANGAVS